MIKFEENFDILNADVDAVVNTVNCVGIMGKGIALQFKQKFQDNFKKYKKACDNKQVKIGKMFVVETGLFKPKIVINFPTKDHWRGNSKIEYITEGLKDLKRVISEFNIKSIALPPLGCGNGGLEWDIVKKEITESLSDLNLEVIVAELYSKKAFVAIQAAKSETMTPFRALVIKAIRLYNEALCGIYELGNIEIQKLVYFLAAITGDERLLSQYQKGDFGPYNPKLKNALINMSSFLTGIGDGQVIDHIDTTGMATQKADEFIKKDSSLANNLNRLSHVIQGYETMYGMELLGTVHWVCNNNKPNSLKEIIDSVHAWNDRKRDIMNEHDITLAYNHLKDCNLVV